VDQIDQSEQAPVSPISNPFLESPSDTPVGTERRDPYKALRYRDFRLLVFAAFLTSIGEQMMSVAIGWELYQRTNSTLALGLVGLVQVLPVIVLSLPAGHLADRANRKRIMLVTQLVFVCGALGLSLLSALQGPLVLIYACLLLDGIAASFSGPVASSLVAQTVPEDAYQSAATWQSSSWQLASVGGPALGGLAIALFHRATPVFLFNVLTLSIVFFCLFAIRSRQPEIQQAGERLTLKSLLEGLNFLRQTQIMLAAITLDLFAVLLGGAVTLLPVYARDILNVGPTGLGWLQAAPAIGAFCMTVLLAYLPPFKKAGLALLLAVTAFGIATCIFGLSRIFWLSLLMLFVLGGMDNISVVIRGTLALTRTPETMRGRVSAVNGLFISMSNQLGGFESGLAAQFLGPVAAVTLGGIGTVIVVALVTVLWPEVRRFGKLSVEKSS
jgi:MFS family permease